MTKEEFKKEAVQILKENNISNKFRIYNYRGSWEVRVYGQSAEFLNSRASFRETSRDEKQRYGSYGIHSRNITLYAHLTENELNNKEELLFFIECCKGL